MRSVIFAVSLFMCSLIFAEKTDYLIITHNNFYTAVQPLAIWKNSKGLKTKIVSVHSGLSSSALKDTIKKYQAEYVLLVGDRSYIPLGKFFPNWSLYQNGTWTDQFYADTTDDNNYRDDIYLGRLPCNTATQCSVMVNKILFYEQGRFNNSDWIIKATGIARDNERPDYDSCYRTAIRDIKTYLVNNGFSQVDTLFQTEGANYATVEDSVSKGRGFVFYRGSTLSSSDNWNNPFGINVENIDNDSMPAVVISPTCRTMFYPGSNELTSGAGFRWLKHGDVDIPKGAVAFWGTTTHYCAGFYDKQTYWRNASAKKFFQAITEDSVHVLGEALRKAKNSALFSCSLYTVGQDSHAVACSVAYMEWNLLGDPELNIWTAIPKPFVVNHDTIINTESQIFTITVKDSVSQQYLFNAKVCLIMDTLIYQIGYTDDLGHVGFVIQPNYPGNLSITVTKPNYIPYKSDIVVKFTHDVGCTKIKSPTGSVIFNEIVTPACSVYNYGIVTENYQIRMKIGSFYNDTVNIINHEPGTYQYVTFKNWEAVQPGFHIVSCSTELSFDGYEINNKHTSAVGCSITVYTIFATTGPNGVIEPSGEVIMQKGNDTTFFITPEPGYYIANLVIDGETIAPLPTYTFENVTTDYTIHAIFNNLTYQLNVATIGNGTIEKCPDLPEYNYGTIVELTAIPEFGWVFIKWSGDTVALDNSITITVTEDKNLMTEFIIGGWQKKRDMLTSDSKGIRDGGALAYLDTMIYAFQGGNKQNFYAYNPITDIWIKRCSIPFTLKLNGNPSKKKVKAGGSLIAYENKIYAFKGGNTCEFWCYFPDSNKWIQKNSIPETTFSSIRKTKIKAGGALVVLGCSIYAFKGGNTDEFWMYNPEQNQWHQRQSLITPDDKKIKTGATLTSYNDIIYALVGGNTNYFYSYVPDTWIKKIDVHFGVPKTVNRKVRNGAKLTAIDGRIYTLKGGGTKDFGYYDIADNDWYTLDTIPGLEKIKGGGALATDGQSVYALKGGNKQKFYKYTPFEEISNIKYQKSNISINNDEKINIVNLKLLRISTNPVEEIMTIDYYVPMSGNVTLKVYNANGRLVESLVDKYLNKGHYSITHRFVNFARGIYILKYDINSNKSNLKIILQ